MNKIFIEKEEAKERILSVAEELFANYGFDGTSVALIAKIAKVNKALIYYYFVSKEEILDTLLGRLFEDMKSMSLDFIRESIVSMINENKLDITEDRFAFAKKNDLDYFIEKFTSYYTGIMEYTVKKSSMFRILLSESLKDGKHHEDLFNLCELSKNSMDNPAYSTIKNADEDFIFTTELVIFRFFFTLFPIIGISIYSQDLEKRVGVHSNELKNTFSKMIASIIRSFTTGNDLMIKAM